MQTTGNLGLKKPEGTDIVDITDLNGNMDILDSSVNGKVDKIAGKQLSTNDYTTAEKTKLTGIATGANNYTHPNHTGDVTSTGDGVTAIAAGVIVDADVNAAAGIAWTKLNKTGASLADLTTRSAGDLTSGTLLAARMPAITGDITMAAGTGTAAITAGAVVNADVNAAAAIDATKIGTGVVSNAEFGYLDGVTSGIQAQLNARPLLTTTPQQTTGNVTYYVRTDGNDSNTGLDNTAGGAFRTINKAIGVIPQIVNHNAIINVAAGTYEETMIVYGFTGVGTVQINGDLVLSTTRNIHSVYVTACTCRVEIIGFNSTRTDYSGFNVLSSMNVLLYLCQIIVIGAAGANGFFAESSKVYINTCKASNRAIGVYAHVNAEILAQYMTGTGNVMGYNGSYGGRVNVSLSTMTATSLAGAAFGGIVTGDSGIINPWGDNTRDQRSAFSAFQSTGALQTISANTQTKILFPSVNYDNLTEYSSSRFTCKHAGLYLISSTVAFPVTGSPAGVSAGVYINGNQSGVIFAGLTSSGNTTIASGLIQIKMGLGAYVEIFAYSSAAITLVASSLFSVTQIA